MANSADWLHLDTFSPMRDDLPRCIKLLNTWWTVFAVKASQCSGHLYWIKAVLSGSMGGLVFWRSQSALYATAVGSESVYSWCDPVTWSEHWIAATVKPFFRCWGDFWFLVEHLSQVERCSGLVSQHCVPLQLDQKVCIHGLIRCKWLERWLALMAKPDF